MKIKKISITRKFLIHRGPDSQKYIKRNGCFMYHSRLKIIDINPRSNQPFTDKDEKYYLLFNGEIYNYLELQKKYKIKINTSSDTEILFLLLKKHGLKKTLREIKGMFSFVFFDTEKKYYFLCKGPFWSKTFILYE